MWDSLLSLDCDYPFAYGPAVAGAKLIGVDVGGSGIKAAVVDLDTGDLAMERRRLPTPEFSTPSAIGQTVASLVNVFSCDGPVGVTLPCVVHNGVAEKAANIDPEWVGTNAVELFTKTLGGREVAVLNDADAAGLAENAYGAAVGRTGTTLVLTFGTGIGSALICDGQLVPNTEFGHLPLNGGIAEHFAAASVRKSEGLSWDVWAERVNGYLEIVESVLRLDLLIIGGGVSAKHDRWENLVKARAPVRPAKCLNNAGLIGAAIQARAFLD